MSGRSRKLDALEQRLHQAILSGKDMTLSQKQVDALEANSTKRIEAINFLLGTGLLRLRTDAKGGISYRAVGKKEVDVKKDLAGEEVLVLNHIQGSDNEGIWTKHLKAKTELHQTVLDRCLKSLVQKQLIKSVKNVKHPTRKTYMLSHLEPSSAITGGPWYTDNELDTEFIKLLSSACLKFIREKSFPKTKSDFQLLFPISASPSYPTAQQIQAFLSKSRITETQLSLEHIEMILNVLVIDGDIEKIPAFGAALWEANSREDEFDEEEGEKRKRKRSGERDKPRRRGTSQADGSDSQDEEDDGGRARKRKRSKSRRDISDESSDDPAGERSNSNVTLGFGPTVMDEDYGGAFVYRATRQERVALGWSQAPCGRCPQFDLCKGNGPVNARDCEYYEQWLARAEVKLE